jgi:hypothetical protein
MSESHFIKCQPISCGDRLADGRSPIPIRSHLLSGGEDVSTVPFRRAGFSPRHEAGVCTRFDCRGLVNERLRYCVAPPAHQLLVAAG